MGVLGPRLLWDLQSGPLRHGRARGTREPPNPADGFPCPRGGRSVQGVGVTVGTLQRLLPSERAGGRLGRSLGKEVSPAPRPCVPAAKPLARAPVTGCAQASPVSSPRLGGGSSTGTATDGCAESYQPGSVLETARSPFPAPAWAAAESGLLGTFLESPWG